MGDTINWGIFKRRFWGELLRHQHLSKPFTWSYQLCSSRHSMLAPLAFWLHLRPLAFARASAPARAPAHSLVAAIVLCGLSKRNPGPCDGKTAPHFAPLMRARAAALPPRLRLGRVAASAIAKARPLARHA